MILSLSVDVERVRTEAVATVNAAAADARAQHVTQGMDAVYAAKEREARALIASPKAPSSRTPHLSAETKAIGKTRRQIAEAVVCRSDAVARVSAAIEAERQRRLAGVHAASTAREIINIARASWPTSEGTQ